MYNRIRLEWVLPRAVESPGERGSFIMPRPGAIRMALSVIDIATKNKSLDAPVIPAAAHRFLNAEGHHILVCYLDAGPVGFITGVEMTHPDKGTEMFLYERGVAGAFRRRGHGGALVRALAALARCRGCYGMWVGTESDNDAALATYRNAVGEEDGFVVFNWTFN